MQRFWDQVAVDNHTGCWEWMGAKNRKGYGTIVIQGDEMMAHRVSWMIHFGFPGDDFVLHKCDNPSCVNPAHLFVGTNQDNMRDASMKGRLDKKLNAEQVINIYERHKMGESQSAIARSLGVTPGMVCRIVNGQRRVIDYPVQLRLVQ